MTALSKSLFFLVAIAFIASLVVVANNQQAVAATQSTPVTTAATEVDMGVIRGRLEQTFQAQPDLLVKAPISGFYQVLYGSQLFYISADGKHLLDGDIIELATLENLTEQGRAAGRRNLLQKVDESSMIVYRAKQQKHVLTVFTDIDCVYCRKLHQDMQQLNELGITVRYLAFPRAGVDSASYEKAVNVWCAKDRNKALDNAKAGGDIEPASCDSPVLQHMALVAQLGLNGTPALLTDDGRLQPGYAPPQQLVTLFE